MPNIGIVILAAGLSERMGSPKQLLKIGDQSLIQHVVKIATSSSFDPIVVVLGNEHEKVGKEITDFDVATVFNHNFKKGMGTSVAKGVEEIQKLESKLDGIIILLVDQPFVDDKILIELEKKYRTSGKKIIASKYRNALGVPTFFDKSTFSELESLSGKKGAKMIIQKYLEIDQVDYVDFPKGAIDLDLPTDYQQFIANLGKR